MTLKSKVVLYCFIFSILYSTISSLCPSGYFRLETMKFCVPWLTCRDIPELKTKELIGYGSTKNVYLAEWNSHNVTYITLKNKIFRYDFQIGLNNMKFFQPSSKVVQLIGFCEDQDVIITEYHRHNNALSFFNFKDKFTLKERFSFCLKYARIIHFLHNSPIGVRVNCDSNDLLKLLSQFLITNDFDLVLGDTDALPEVKTNLSITCGPKEIQTDFVAPEQLWHGQEIFHIKKMKGYNEKTDIWKLPDVCLYFLTDKDVELLQYLLFDIHKQCKEIDPLKRPSAQEVVSKYNEIFLSL